MASDEELNGSGTSETATLRYLKGEERTQMLEPVFTLLMRYRLLDVVFGLEYQKYRARPGKPKAIIIPKHLVGYFLAADSR